MSHWRSIAISRYEVLDKIAQGAHGAVYEAYDPDLTRTIALKLTDTSALPDSELPHMVQEAQAMARVEHPNVVKVYDAGTTDGGVFIAMQRIQGRSLGAQLAHERTIAVSRLRTMVVQLCEGLAAIHAAATVHRDIKPDNTLLDGDRVYISDFGLARPVHQPRTGRVQDAADDDALSLTDYTLTQGFVGTPMYAAPEVLAGEPATSRSDQYSLALSIYLAATGAMPHELPSSFTALRTIREQLVPASPLRRAGFTKSEVEALTTALAPLPQDRHSDIEALANVFRASQRRSRWFWATTGLAAVLAAIAIGWWLSSSQSEQLLASCDARAHQFAQVWSDRRDIVKDKLSRPKFTYAQWPVVSSYLDELQTQGRRAYRESCRARYRNNTATELVHENFVYCVAQVETLISDYIDVISTRDSLLPQSVAGVRAISLAPCLEGDYGLRFRGIIAPQARQQLAEYHRTLKQIAQATYLGDPTRAREIRDSYRCERSQLSASSDGRRKLHA